MTSRATRGDKAAARSLVAYVNDQIVGTLHENGDLWAFEYDAAWSNSAKAFDLSPALARSQLQHADGGSHRPVQWYFDNLLPEEELRIAIEKEAHLKGKDAFALLEYLGAESAGALTLLPPGVEPAREVALRPLEDAELSARIDKLPRSTLTKDAPKRMSLAGAQHKMLVVYEKGRLYEPVEAAPSTHILKPNHPFADYPASVVNEYFTMKLADAVGLKVPHVHWRHTPQPVYLIERFDRRRPEGQPYEATERLHVIDACQLLNKARTYKHALATLESMREIIASTSNKVLTQVRLFRWLVFNVMTANDDCHLKNLSFLVSADGIELAPHYDLLFTGAYRTRAFEDEAAPWPNLRMAIALPGATTFAQVTRACLEEAGMALGLGAATVHRTIDHMIKALPAAAATLIAQIGTTLDGLPADARIHAAGERRLLAAAQKTILDGMIKRVASSGSAGGPVRGAPTRSAGARPRRVPRRRSAIVEHGH